MGLSIIRENITNISADAIVNSANPMPIYLNGVDREIYMAAGPEKLLEERIKKGEMGVGDIWVSEAYDILSVKHIIHVVVPRWAGGNSDEYEYLKKCYENVLKTAISNNYKSIAIPLLGTGTNGFPVYNAFAIAEEVCRKYIMEYRGIKIWLVIFDKHAFETLQPIHGGINELVNDSLVERKIQEEYKKEEDGKRLRLPTISKELKIHNNQDKYDNLEINVHKQTKLDFYKLLDEYYNEFVNQPENRGLSQEKIASLCGISPRSLKYKLNPEKKGPRRTDRDTVIGLCVGLNLGKDKSIKLLESNGYSLNPCDKRDSIIMEYINIAKGNATFLNIQLRENGLPELSKNKSKL